MLIKTKYVDYYLYSDKEESFFLEPRLCEQLKKRLEQIEFIILKKDIDALFMDRLESEIKKRNITITDADTLIERINCGELRYSESKNEKRFLFYNDIEKELRSVIVGTSNFLLIRGIEGNKNGDEYDFDYSYIDHLLDELSTPLIRLY